MKKLIVILFIPILLTAIWDSENFTVENGKLISNQVNGVYFYDTRADSDGGLWRLSNTKSWFHEPSYPGDDFWGNSMDGARWNSWDTGNYFTMANRLHFYRGITPNEYYESNITSTWQLSGNFDVTIDFELIQWNPAQFQRESSIRLEFWVNEANFCKLWRYRHTDDNYWGEFWINGNHYPGRESSGVGNEYYGKLRLTRNGNLLEMWRLRISDNTWQRVFHRTDFSNQAGNIRLAFTNYSPIMEAAVDNFIIHAGQTTFGQVGSAQRGIQNAFPEQAILIRTEKSLDIFDADSQDLWMRFTGVPSNNGAINGSSNCVYGLNGRIYTTWDDAYHGLVLIDFNTDEICYLSATYNQKYAYNIAGRNQLGDWLNITPPYFINTDEIVKVTGHISGNNEIIGIASGNGVRIVKNQEYAYQSSYSNPILAIHFHDTGRLFFTAQSFVTTSGTNYLTANFSNFYNNYISNLIDLTSNENYLFAASANGVYKLNINPLSQTGTIYTSTAGLAPTSSNNCIGVYAYNDTLFVAASHTINGKISAVNTANNQFLFSIESGDLLSPESSAFSAGVLPIFDRNLLWATNHGLNYFYGSSDLVKGVTIEAQAGIVNLSWARVIPANQYHIYRSTVPYFEVSPETYIGSCNDTSYTDYIITKSNIKHFYRITWE